MDGVFRLEVAARHSAYQVLARIRWPPILSIDIRLLAISFVSSIKFFTLSPLCIFLRKCFDVVNIVGYNLHIRPGHYQSRVLDLPAYLQNY